MEEYVTKDSGNRETYDSGMVRDTQLGKPRFDLMDPVGVPYRELYSTRIAIALAKDAEEYGDRHWEKEEGEAGLAAAMFSTDLYLHKWKAGEADQDYAAYVHIGLLQAETFRFDIKHPGVRKGYDSPWVRDYALLDPRFDLMDPLGVPYRELFSTRIAMLLSRGSEKYGDRNWEKGDSEAELTRAMSSAPRHFKQYKAGEVDEDHAAAVHFNILQAETLRYRLRLRGEL